MKKIFSILLVCFLLFSLVGCGKHLTTEEYNQLENNFYSIYDSIVKDFYSEAVQGSNSKLISGNLYHNHKDDIDKLNTILSGVEDSEIPNDKKNAYKKMDDEFLNIFFLSSASVECEVPNSVTEKEKQDLINNCNQFLFLNKDRIDKLGINQGTQASSNNKKPDLELLDKSDKYDNGTIYITGHIKNNTKNNYNTVYISINLYNDSALVGNTNDIVNNLEAGTIWEFKAITTVNFNSYKISDIHGTTN